MVFQVLCSTKMEMELFYVHYCNSKPNQKHLAIKKVVAKIWKRLWWKRCEIKRGGQGLCKITLIMMTQAAKHLSCVNVLQLKKNVLYVLSNHMWVVTYSYHWKKNQQQWKFIWYCAWQGGYWSIYSPSLVEVGLITPVGM